MPPEARKKSATDLSLVCQAGEEDFRAQQRSKREKLHCYLPGKLRR